MEVKKHRVKPELKVLVSDYLKCGKNPFAISIVEVESGGFISIAHFEGD